MENPRPEKVAVVAEVADRLAGAEAVVLTGYQGLSVAEMQRLRRTLAESGGQYKVYKNTLVRFAAVDAGLDIEDLLSGPTALAFAAAGADGTKGDPVALAKVLRSFAQENDKLVIKGGMLGSRRLSPDDVIELARIAPREELLARLAGGFAAPMRQFAGLLAAVPQNFAYALKALIDDRGASGAHGSEPAAEAIEAVVESAADAAAQPAADAADESGE